MKNSNIFAGTLVAVFLLLGLVSPVYGDGDESMQRSKGSSNFEARAKAVKAANYESALIHLKKALKESPEDADVHNLLGYSYRKLGNTKLAFEHYLKALSIEPKHRGVNEYLGELYLETQQLAKAEERLKVLATACVSGCEEYDDLKVAIQQYKARPRSN